MKKLSILFALLIGLSSHMAAMTLQEYMTEHGQLEINPYQCLGNIINMLDLANKDITDISGISTISVHLSGTSIPITEVPLLLLDLSNNQLTELPADIGALTNLRFLDLSNNKLNELHADIGNLKNLHALDLSNNKLNELRADIGDLINLHALDLSKNQLTELHADIGNLKNLGHLDLSNNQLTELPSNIGGLAGLLNLNLGYNQLTKLPASIGDLTKLKEFNLANNKLTELPENIGQLMNLKDLNLSNNRLTNIPWSILRLVNINKFNVMANASLLTCVQIRRSLVGPVDQVKETITSTELTWSIVGLKKLIEYFNKMVKAGLLTYNQLKKSLVGSDEVKQALEFLRKLHNEEKLFYGDPLNHFAKTPEEIASGQESSSQFPQEIKDLIYSFAGVKGTDLAVKPC